MKKVILITGGSEGLGLEISKKLCPDNIVIILANKPDKVQEACSFLGCEGFHGDITNPEDIEKSVSAVVKKYGRIDVLINNAGIWLPGELSENKYEDIAQVVLINSVGTMNITKAVIPYMKKQRAGQIVFINSVDGLETKVERSIYVASKWALTGFAKSLRKELQKDNVGVISLFPGLMNTNLFKNAGGGRDLTDAMEPAEVARIIEFAVSFDDIVLEQVVFRKMNGHIYG